MFTSKLLYPAVLLLLVGGRAEADDAVVNEGAEVPSGTASLSSTSLYSSASLSKSSFKERTSLGVFIGGNYISSENELGNAFHGDQVPGSGFLLGLRGSYLLFDSLMPSSTLAPQLSAELEAKFTISSTDGSSERSSQTSSVVGWRANLRMDFLPDRKLVPFALIGVGGETVIGSHKFMTSPDTDIATYYGGGVRYPLNDNLDLRGDLRLGLTAGRKNALSALGEVHLGVSYRFGKSASSPAVLPLVETTPPVKESVDTDGDGISDELDACPKISEIYNGIDDTDGCPEVDSDHDGLLGSLDQCPAAAEDMDGFQDEDGCPDPDNDLDGRPDMIDVCPGQPETLNGYEDEDGCPDEIPVKLAKFTGTIRGIQFKTGSARILRKSYRTLNAAVSVLKKNPSVRIEISGHTDNQGSEQSNRKLSRKRSDYVKWYLVDKGISAERIETVGYGSEKPVEDNATKAGRRKNRRIEFRLLPGADRLKSPGARSVPVIPAGSPAAPVVPAGSPAAPVVPVGSPAAPVVPAGSPAAPVVPAGSPASHPTP